MNCEDYQKMISRWLDGELEEAEINSLDSHLRDCPGCRRLKSEFSALHRIHIGIGDQPVPEHLTAESLCGPEKVKYPAAWRILSRMAVAAAVAGVIIVGAGIGGSLAEKDRFGGEAQMEEVMNLKYLQADPPGSTGDLLNELFREENEDAEG